MTEDNYPYGNIETQSQKPAAPKKNTILKIFLWILGITGGSVLLFSFGFLLLFIILVIAGSKMVNVEKIISPQTGYTETLISGKGEDKIVVIPVTGIIQTHDTRGMFGRFNAGAQEIIRQLKQAGKDNYVKAVILNINSPGGSITASDIIYNQILKLKALDKKIIVSMGDVAASGGYYIAAPAHKIIAHPTTITGSTGVISQWAHMESLYEKIWFQARLRKAGDNEKPLPLISSTIHKQLFPLHEFGNLFSFSYGQLTTTQSSGL